MTIKKTPPHQKKDLEFDNLLQKLKCSCDQANVGLLDLENYENIACVEKKFWICIFARDLLVDLFTLDRINQFLVKHDKQLLICTDNIFTDNNFSNIKFFTHKTLIGINYLHVDLNRFALSTHHSVSKLYNCFINRGESTRQSWLYFLHYHNLLDKGYVSYNCYQTAEYSHLQGVELFDYIHYNYGLDKVRHFDQAYHALRPLIPFQNFTENHMLEDKIMDSKYSLVLDTYAVEDHSGFWFFSEKIWRALMLPNCHLLFAQKGALTQFANLGFEISKSNLEYDNLDWIPRQRQICQLLIDDADEYNFDFLKERALHNYHVLKNMYDSSIDQFCDQVIDLAQAKFC